MSRALPSPRPEDAALAALVVAERRRVHRFGRRVCRDRFDADDAVQEALLRLARRPELVASGGAVPWLLAVVRHACLRLLRPMARWRTLADPGAPDAEPDGAPSPEAALQRAEEERALRAALDALDPVHREVLLLDLEGRSGVETARALGIALPAMKARLHRARRALGERLRDAEGPPAQRGRA